MSTASTAFPMYDSHREAILRGGLNADYEDDSVDLLQYFTSTCYSGYGDDEKGFYAVYRGIFEQIVQEELESLQEPEDLAFPTFGDSRSDYKTVVHLFYAHWQSFCTRRSMAWRDKYDTRQASNHWEKRAMDKENRKIREKARKERNEVVRQLVAFIRKRDRRVQAHCHKLKEENAEKTKRFEELRRRQKLQQARLAEQYQEQSWVAMSDLEKELQQMEAQYEEEFGDGADHLESSGDQDLNGAGDDNVNEKAEDDSDYCDDLYCPACEKIFQSTKALKNHRKSKKHREMVILLRQQLEAEENDLCARSAEGQPGDQDSGEDQPGDQDSGRDPLGDQESGDDHLGDQESGGDQLGDLENGEDRLRDLESEEDQLIEEVQSRVSKKQKKKQKQKIFSESSPEATDSQSITSSTPHSEDRNRVVVEEEVRLADSCKLHQAQKPDCHSAEQEEVSRCIDQQQETRAEEITATSQSFSKAKRRKGKDQKKGTKVAGVEKAQETTICATCSSEFASRNKLFEHLKATGHATAQHCPTSSSQGRTAKRRNR
ncbi:dnaJ homolog subfamily C member 21 [Rhincodon typus]|uniref:dnaJ homolog subfamily C member 21 n=1 Tax=Rhincodon typus TaxID=259920 RepID=UPI00202E8ECF|nr:dnaJ homolog subfamily C member 21 [Rhincodon typus]